MQRLVVLAVVAATIVTLAISGWSAAGPRQYQFTGAVTEVDIQGETLSVDKGGDVWQFSVEGLKGLKIKKGDRVTVYYTMIARRVEMK